MPTNLVDKIHRINYLTSEMDALYHQASFKIGLADSAMRVLYALHDNGQSCLLSQIYKQSGISKQTVHSAVRKLEEEGLVYLEPHRGKAKMVCLTQQGKQYVSDTVARLYEAEIRAFASWSEEEIDAHVRLMEKYLECFRAQVRQL